MKFLDENTLDEITNCIDKCLTHEVKAMLINLHTKFGIWFISDPITNRSIFNTYVHNEMLALTDGAGYLYRLPSNDQFEQAKQRITYIINHYYKEHMFLETFTGFRVMHSAIQNCVRPYLYDLGINLIDLIQCDNVKEYMYTKHSIDNLDKSQVKRIKEIQTNFESIVNEFGIDKAYGLFRAYGSNPTLAFINNILY